MPKPTKGPRLGASPTHERMILGQLCSQLFEHGAIITTEAKAKRMRPYAEKWNTKAKRGDLHARRLAARVIRDKGVLAHLFEDIAPMMQERNGGYTRMIRVGFRQGDSAPLARVELVTEKVTPKAKAEAPAKAEEAKTEAVEAEEAQPEPEAEQKVEEPAAE